jgi:hypothetical protein
MGDEGEDFYYLCRIKKAEGCCLACKKEEKKLEGCSCPEWKCNKCVWYLPDNEREKCGKKLLWEKNLKKHYKQDGFKDYLKPVRPNKTQAIIQEYGK